LFTLFIFIYFKLFLINQAHEHFKDCIFKK
jgi:hypothetical protein